MKNKAIVAVIVVVILAVGGYLVFHKSPSTKTPTTPSTTGKSVPRSAPPAVFEILNTGTTSFLADANNKPLYTYSGDTAGTSNCTGSCVANWPAYAVTDSSTSLPANITVIKRADGTSQYAYKSQPLYYFISDTKPGTPTGDGVEGFSLAKP